jgi:hypothetical protein
MDKNLKRHPKNFQPSVPKNLKTQLFYGFVIRPAKTAYPKRENKPIASSRKKVGKVQ